MTIETRHNIRVQRAIVDITWESNNKEIRLPSLLQGALQFSLITNPREPSRFIEGIARIETEEQFDEFFDALRSLSFYSDFRKEFAVHQEGRENE